MFFYYKVSIFPLLMTGLKKRAFTYMKIGEIIIELRQKIDD